MPTGVSGRGGDTSAFGIPPTIDALPLALVARRDAARDSASA
jgi:hypothetical protein